MRIGTPNPRDLAERTLIRGGLLAPSPYQGEGWFGGKIYATTQTDLLRREQLGTNNQQQVANTNNDDGTA